MRANGGVVMGRLEMMRGHGVMGVSGDRALRLSIS